MPQRKIDACASGKGQVEDLDLDSVVMYVNSCYGKTIVIYLKC